MLEGHVRDRIGRPVAGAELTLLREMGGTLASMEARTEFDGWFTVGPLLWAEDYVICVSPIAGAGWATRVPLRVAAGEGTWRVELYVDVGGTLAVRVHNVPVQSGNVELRLLRQDGSVAACAVGGTAPSQNCDPEIFGDRWSFVEAFRGLAAGTYRLECSTKAGALAGTPLTVEISQTDPVIVDIGDGGEIGGSPPPGCSLIEDRDPDGM